MGINIPEGFDVTPTHDGTPMRLRSTGGSWEGPFKVITRRFICDCGLTCEVQTRELDAEMVGSGSKAG